MEEWESVVKVRVSGRVWVELWEVQGCGCGWRCVRVGGGGV